MRFPKRIEDQIENSAITSGIGAASELNFVKPPGTIWLAQIECSAIELSINPKKRKASVIERS